MASCPGDCVRPALARSEIALKVLGASASAYQKRLVKPGHEVHPLSEMQRLTYWLHKFKRCRWWDLALVKGEIQI